MNRNIELKKIELTTYLFTVLKIVIELQLNYS